MGEIFYIKKLKINGIKYQCECLFLFVNNFKGDNKNWRIFKVFLLIYFLEIIKNI